MILQIVMTHREALPTVERHLRIWEGITKNIIFTSPEDSFMSEGRFVFGYPEVRMGLAEHAGELSRQRIIKILEYALTQACWTHLLLMEYDSFALNLPPEVVPAKGGVSAAVYSQNKPIKYKARFYCHYPMLFDFEGLKKTCAMLPKVTSKDRFFSDRFLGMGIQLSGIPINDLKKSGKGFSKNTIEEKHYPALRAAVKGGAAFFHGVKNVETLKIIKGEKDVFM